MTTLAAVTANGMPELHKLTPPDAVRSGNWGRVTALALQATQLQCTVQAAG